MGRGTVTRETEGVDPAATGDAARLRTDPSADDASSRWAPLALVALAVAFNLWVLRAQLLPVHQPNDNAVHQSMIRWALDRIQGGHLPFDGWYPYLGLGSSLFHHYQSLPHTLTAVLALGIGEDRAFSGTLYLLLATWPVSVYLGARLLGWERWVAAGVALLSPFLVSASGYGYEHGSYVFQSGLGLWSQLWGMWLLPLAWGFSWRAVSGRSRTLGIAALFVGLTAACHFLTGFMAILVLPVWVLITPSEFLRRLARAAAVGIGGLLIVAWVLVPLLLDSTYSTVSRYLTGTYFADSFGARRVFGWLVSGQLFDGLGPAYAPVVSLLVGIGAIVCVARFRSDERARALLGALALALILFSGRSPFGPLLDLIPGSADLLLHRFISGVHMAGVLLAGVGAAWVVALVRRGLSDLSARPARVGLGAALIGLALLALGPAWQNRLAFGDANAASIQAQRAADAGEGANVDDLIAEAKRLGGGRIFAGTNDGKTGGDRVGEVGIYADLLSADADAVGFDLRTTSLSTDVEVLFDPTNPQDYDLFDVRYLILPVGREPAVPAELVDTEGAHSLWRVSTTGYLEVVDTLAAIAADRTNLAERVQGWMRSPLPAQGRYPAIAFAGAPAASPTAPPTGGPTSPPGVVTHESAALQEGVVEGEVDLDRPGMVVLKTSFDPRWTVTVDGEEQPAQMVAPSFVGREVEAGHHSIAFVYHPFPRYDLLFLVGVLTFIGMQWGLPWVVRRRRDRGISAASGP